MAYDTRESSRIRRSRQQERVEAANRRIRRLNGEIHPYRWCPEHEVSILVGPDFVCPACGMQTSLTD